MPGPRRFWGDGDPKQAQVIFGASCDGDGGNVCSSALVLIQGVWFSVRLSNESPSLIEALQKWNSLSPPWRAFNHFGVTFADCLEDNLEATIRVMRECCGKEIKRVKDSRGFDASERLPGWKSLLGSLENDSSPELQELLENTIRQLEEVSLVEEERLFPTGSD